MPRVGSTGWSCDVVTRRGGLRRRGSGMAAQAAPARARGDVTVALVSDARVRALNRRYRGKDHATDVLSFPPPTSRAARLGDIVIAAGVRAAGRAQAHALRADRAAGPGALHGLLHLLGYDHERDDGRMAASSGACAARAGCARG